LRGLHYIVVVLCTAPLTNFDSGSAIMSQLRIFGGVTDAQMAILFRRLELWQMQEGEVVFHKGDEPHHIYIVQSGKIDLQITEDTVLIHKHKLRVGECFGEASLMSMHKHTSTAVAAEASEIIVLSRKALINLKHEDVELFALLMMNLARELARRLYITDQMLLEATARRATPGSKGS
jgi:CRP/FNR family transcriptional regulator, cyclic AMP receptor protein